MLTYMRKHSKSWMIKIIFGAIIVTFVAWGGSAYMAREEGKIAKIDKHIISAQEYQKAYSNTIEAYRQQYGTFFNEEMIKMLNLKTRVLDQLIYNYIMELEAHRMGITVSNDDLQESIRNLPAFNTNGAFDMSKYSQILEYMRVTPAEFEAQQRSELLRQRLNSIVTQGVSVSSKEVEAAYHKKEDIFDLSFVCVTPDQFKNSVKVDDAVVKAWYDSHKETYKVPPMTKISYINFDTSKYAAEVKVSNDDVQKYYNDNIADFTMPAKVHGQQILILLPVTADEKMAKEKEKDAKKIVDETKKGADFSELAKKFSQDPMTAKKGGDMGLVEKEKLPEGLGDILYSMKPGEVRGPIKTGMGLVILKLRSKEEEKTKPLEEASPLITEKLTALSAKDKSYDEANKAFTSIYEDPKSDIHAYAIKHTLEVKEFGPFSENELAAIPGGTKVIKDAAARINGDIGDIIDTGSGYLVYKVTGKVNSRIAGLEEVRDRVLADAAKDKMAEAAKNYTVRLAGKGTAALNAMSHESTGTFKRSDYSVPKLGGDQKLKGDLDSLFNPKAYQLDGKSCVAWIRVFVSADPSSLTPAKASTIKKELLGMQKEAMFESFLKNAKAKHKIEIMHDKLK